MSDWRERYWLEAVNDALEYAGATGALTPEQIKALADGLVGWAENEGTGRPPTPANPMESEVRRLKEAHRAEVARLEAQIDAYRGSVARRRNVPKHSVFIENGDVVYER